MFLLRRATRVVSAAPSRSLFAQPRLAFAFTSPALRKTQQQWSIASLQKRYASDEAAKVEAAQAAAADSAENFAQTAAEPPMEDGLTPAQQQAEAKPTDAERTDGSAALEQAAGRAARTTNGYSRSTRGARPDYPATPSNTLYVGNLFYEVTSDQVERVFSRFGEVESVRLVSDNRGMSKGFGYVVFKNIDEAQAAIDNLHEQTLEGRSLVVQFHRAKPSSSGAPRSPYGTPMAPSKTLFIGNMSFEMSDKDLNDLFRDIRNVMDVRVAIDRRTGQPRGFAHADFIDVASATKARDALQNKVIYGRTLRVDFGRSAAADGRGRRAERADSTQDSTQE